MIKNCVFCKTELLNDVCQRRGCNLFGIYMPDSKEAFQDPKKKYSNLEESTRQILLAQDRTTHAVRAFVRFIFIQLTAITISGLVILFGSFAVNESVIVIGVLIYIAGVIWSSNAGWSELEKSNITNQ